MKNITQKQNNRTRIITLRLTPEEYAQLEYAAQGVPLGPFIRSHIVDSDNPKVRTRNRHPVKDHVPLAKILGELGRLHIFTHLEELALAVRVGALEVSSETEKMIQEACETLNWIRKTLLTALGLKAGNGNDS